MNAERFLADHAPPVCSLNIADAFKALTKEESKLASCFSELGGV